MNLELASIPKVRRNACITFTKVSSVVNNSILVKAHLSLPMKSCQQRQQWCQSAQIIYPNDKIESITCTRVVKKDIKKQMIYLATIYCYNESQFQSMLTRKKKAVKAAILNFAKRKRLMMHFGKMQIVCSLCIICKKV